MTNVRENLHIEPFLLVRHNLNCPAALLGHKETICVRHGEENRRLNWSAVYRSLAEGLLPSMLNTWLSFMNAGWAMAPALQNPSLESWVQTNRAPQLVRP